MARGEVGSDAEFVQDFSRPTRSSRRCTAGQRAHAATSATGGARRYSRLRLTRSATEPMPQPNSITRPARSPAAGQIPVHRLGQLAVGSWSRRWRDPVARSTMAGTVRAGQPVVASVVAAGPAGLLVTRCPYGAPGASIARQGQCAARRPSSWEIGVPPLLVNNVRFGALPGGSRRSHQRACSPAAQHGLWMGLQLSGGDVHLSTPWARRARRGRTLRSYSGCELGSAARSARAGRPS